MNNTVNTQKVALITGGSKRIGKQISKTLHEFGYNVIIHYHKGIDTAQTLCDELNTIRPNSAKMIGADLAITNNKDKLTEFKHKVLDLFGRLDCIIHNASSFYPSDLDDDFAQLQNHWNDLFLTNAKAPFFISQTFIDALNQTNGCIVSLLDIHAHDKPFVGYPIYNMAKAAHRMLVQSLALELAPSIRINGVAPGVNIFPEDNTNAQLNQDTKASLIDSIPLARIGTPDDIAQAVLFFCQATYITGQVLAVDGGRSLTLKGG